MILIDASVAPRVARAICLVRDDVRSVADIYPDATADTTWLLEAGVNNWLVITRDKKIPRRRPERQVILDHAVGAFIIGQRGRLTRWDYLRIIVSTLDEKDTLFASVPRPFVFRIDSELQFRQILPRPSVPRSGPAR